MSDKVPDVLKDYSFIKDIGEGNFGKVKLSKLISTNEKYAIKILNKQKLKAQTKTSSINEIEILSKLNHPNIIHVEKILEDEENFYIIMEYCCEGELFDYIVKLERLNEMEAAIFFYQLIKGVEYIHEQNLAHRDLKPENLLLTKNHILKIIDFGLCHDFDGTKLLKTKCGSPSYAAPEILKGFPYNGFKSDIWCCGIILYGMLCGYLPFDGENNQEIFREIVQCNPEYPPFLEDDSIDLISKILNPEPNDRITIDQIKKHPFFTKGKYYYFSKYNENGDSSEQSFLKSHSNSNSSIRGNNRNKSGDKKQYIYSSIKKHKDNAILINNIKTLTKKNHKKYEKSIYKNIFKTIGHKEEINKKNDKKFFLLRTLEDNENVNIKNDKVDTKTLNNERKFSELKENEEKHPLFLKTFKNKFNGPKLKLNTNNKFFDNNNNLNFHSISSNRKNDSNQKNKITFEFHSLNSTKSGDKNPFNKMNLIINNKRQILNNKYDKNILKDQKGKKEELNFLQNFLSNKNKKSKNEITIKSPEKRNDINFNLILTKSRKSGNEKIFSEKKNKYNNNKAFSAQKIKKSLSQKKKLILNFVNSPSNIKNSNTKRDKFNILFNQKDTNSNRLQNNGNNNNYLHLLEKGDFSYSIKKNSRNNPKFNNNKNIKLININNKGNSVKKEGKNIFIKTNPTYKNEAVKEILLKCNITKKKNDIIPTEPKTNQFLEKVIKKMYTKDKPIINNNINIITFNNNFGTENDNQVFRMLQIAQEDKNNNVSLECPYLINKKNVSNNENENKKFHINLNNEKKLYLLKNPKILDNNRLNSKEKMKKIFPNLISHNKNC
jgi:5'-AMP-activated protein kinase catalytic alpha subunit